MKVLYALPGTGNGHLARAQEVIPRIMKFATVDILLSGSQYELEAPFKVKFALPGISLFYDKSGGISYFKTLTKNHIFKSLRSIWQLPIKEYDLVISDFEPISAWAAKLRSVPIISLSHQVAMTFSKTPKPEKIDFFGELILKKYTPSKNKVGFHFKQYEKGIYLPIIRGKIRDLKPTYGKHFVVYIPGVGDENLFRVLNKIDVEWKVFSKYCKEENSKGNVHFYPVNESIFLNELASCKGVLCNAGFELPAEAIFLKKSIYAIPLKGQYEQGCNAAALREMGAHTNTILDVESIQKWTKNPIILNEDYTKDQLDEILDNHIKL